MKKKFETCTRPPDSGLPPAPDPGPKLGPPPASRPPASGLPPLPLGPRCQCCRHPDREALDLALTAGDRSVPELAQAFTVSVDSIHRHRKGCVPTRLLRASETVAAEADRQFAKLAITSSANRLADLQSALDGLQAIRKERQDAADPAVPGDRSGLILKRKRAIRRGKGWEQVIETELDSAWLAEMRALHLAAARETGEWLAQVGRSSFGAGEAGRGPLVVVFSSGLQPLPGPEPGVARHRIADVRRRQQPTAAEIESLGTPPLGLIDVEQQPAWAQDEADGEAEAEDDTSS